MTRRIHIPDSFDLPDGGEISFNDVHQRFASTHFGKHLAEQVRYERYKPGCISNMEWYHSPLGADTNNLKHLALTAGLTRHYLKNQQPEKALNHTDSQVLLLTAITHDWAESIISDICFDQKTPEDEKDEATMMLFLLRKILGRNLPQTTRELILRTASDKSSRLGEIFNAIEKVGYLRTGLNAWDASNRPEGEIMKGVDPEVEIALREGFQWLASNVAGNIVPSLLKYAQKFHPISVYMGNVRHRISTLFQNMPVSVFENYSREKQGNNEQLQQMQKFMNAYSEWQASKFSSNSTGEDKH